MRDQSIDIFALRDTLIGDYTHFVTSFTKIHAPDIKDQVDAIFENNHYWPEPLIQINPNYQQSTTVQDWVNEGGLAPECAQIFGSSTAPFTLYEHQKQSISAAMRGESYVVTTGTGSGKSLCFFIPIIDRVLREKKIDSTKRTRAIVIYPMNALANSQEEELTKYLGDPTHEAPVTFARYTGDVAQEERERIAANPPDILLTNFMMLELLMTRQNELDRTVIRNCEGLDFLVLDELHTYRGRQGADVAMLIRRMRARLRTPHLQCVGTSATMASEGDLESKQRVVAEVASKLFAQPLHHSNIITETLDVVTPRDVRVDDPRFRDLLTECVDSSASYALTNEQLQSYPFSSWVERTLGVHYSDVDNRWERAKPLSLTQAAEQLALDCDQPVERCKEALKSFLIESSKDEAARTGNMDLEGRGFFAFKLHQFISGTGYVYSTLDAPGTRLVTVNGQKFHPDHPDKRLYPTHFCRTCGHEYHPVIKTYEGNELAILPRSIDAVAPKAEEDEDDAGGDEFELYGFLTLHPDNDPFDFEGEVEHYPESWLDPRAKTTRLRSNRRKRQAQELFVLPSGTIDQNGQRAWFLPGKFPFCLRCGEAHNGPSRDRTRLASLAAEGRSSATSVLVSSALQWMHNYETPKNKGSRKLLGFTDNRQDAALQAGHFNDFHFVCLLRSGFLQALKNAGPQGLEGAEIGLAIQKSLGFTAANTRRYSEWLVNPAVRGSNLPRNETLLRDILAYRTWQDQRRGWRYTNPNLEELGLVAFEYIGLDDLVLDDELHKNAPEILRRASRTVRKKVYRVLLDYLLKGFAVASTILTPATVHTFKKRSASQLMPPWGLSNNEELEPSRHLMIEPPKRTKKTRGMQDAILSGNARSVLGRRLKDSSLWDGDREAYGLKLDELNELIETLLQNARTYGLVNLSATHFDVPGWQLIDDVVRFTYQSTDQNAPQQGDPSRDHAFFRDLYENLANVLGSSEHALFEFEGREHTAQVESARREIREQRFRYTETDQEKLTKKRKEEGQHDISTKFLPVLFCSPTMELGVDISTLNVVHMRNVPPTPANYAQRSGRAGRSGQAALVITYCAAQSPHDQNFFHNPPAMVHGQVNAPLLDLANQSLIDSHLQAVWLSHVDYPIPPTIWEMLNKDEASHRTLIEPLQDAIQAAQQRPHAAQQMREVLRMVESELTPEQAPWFNQNIEAYAEKIAQESPQRFDQSFNRWRELLRTAEHERDSAQKIGNNLALLAHERKSAQLREERAKKQIELLVGGKESMSSDFYSYRYLATEGFLPGYNFPRLPLMAYIPGSREDRNSRSTYLRRPRFLALAEFGPGSLVYHEGRAYRVHRAILPVSSFGGTQATAGLATQSVSICERCGAGHFNSERSTCHNCNEPLSSTDIISNVLRIDNVATLPASRITANDEERQRQGFDLQTTFEWAPRGGTQTPNVRRLPIIEPSGHTLADVHFGESAVITRLNKGLRRRADQSVYGFSIDPLTGEWRKSEEDTQRKNALQTTQRVVPAVRDHKNALLFFPSYVGANIDDITPMATLQYALLRGIETHFQLEEGEILAEPMPSRTRRRGLLLYEADEGGAGVLTQLVSHPKNLNHIARIALERMHYDLSDGLPSPDNYEQLLTTEDADCAAGCYRCLLSYYNQTDHESIDRRNDEVLYFLLRLAHHPFEGSLFELETQPTDKASASRNASALEEASPPWFAQLAAHNIPLPDTEALVVEDATIPYVWRDYFVAVLPEDVSARIVVALHNLGFATVLSDADPADFDVDTLLSYFKG